MKTEREKFADALAWLASAENKDEGIRMEAKGILDSLCLLEQMTKKGAAK